MISRMVWAQRPQLGSCPRCPYTCRLVGNRSPYLKIAETRCQSIQLSRLPGCLSHETMLHRSLNLILIKNGEAANILLGA